MSILTTVCGPCAENIQKHFDFISNGVDLDGQGSCVACHAPADLGFVLPKSVFLLGLEGVRYAGTFTFEVVGFDLSKASELVRDFTELSALLSAADVFASRLPAGIGKCEISVTDEDGYTISLHASHDLVMRFMSKFGKVTRGADDE